MPTRDDTRRQHPAQSSGVLTSTPTTLMRDGHLRRRDQHPDHAQPEHRPRHVAHERRQMRRARRSDPLTRINDPRRHPGPRHTRARRQHSKRDKRRATHGTAERPPRRTRNSSRRHQRLLPSRPAARRSSSSRSASLGEFAREGTSPARQPPQPTAHTTPAEPRRTPPAADPATPAAGAAAHPPSTRARRARRPARVHAAPAAPPASPSNRARPSAQPTPPPVSPPSAPPATDDPTPASTKQALQRALTRPAMDTNPPHSDIQVLALEHQLSRGVAKRVLRVEEVRLDKSPRRSLPSVSIRRETLHFA